MGNLLATAAALSADRSAALPGAAARRRRGPKRLRLTDDQRIDIAVTYAGEVARVERLVDYHRARGERESVEFWERVARERHAILAAVALGDDQAESLLAAARQRATDLVP